MELKTWARWGRSALTGLAASSALIVAAVSFAACGGGDATDPPSAPEDSSPPQEPVTPPEGDDQTAPAPEPPDQGAPEPPADTTPEEPSGSTPPDGTGEDDPGPGQPTAADAVAVVQGYFEAINAGNYAEAYAFWGDDGANSGQTFEEFRAGYAETASALVEIGEPGRVEGAAGSVYIDIPVTITATTTSGATQRFEGSFALRRASNIPGATEEQKQWHLHSTEITEVNA